MTSLGRFSWAQALNKPSPGAMSLPLEYLSICNYPYRVLYETVDSYSFSYSTMSFMRRRQVFACRYLLVTSPGLAPWASIICNHLEELGGASCLSYCSATPVLKRFTFEQEAPSFHSAWRPANYVGSFVISLVLDTRKEFNKLIFHV